MNYSAIAVRYSKALLSLAEEKGIMDEILQDISTIQQICNTEPEFIKFLEYPVLPASKKTEVFTLLFLDKVNQLTLQFLKMISSKRREAYLPGMALAFLSQYKTRKGIKTVTFTTVSPIEDKVRNTISNIIKNLYKTDIEFTEQTNKDLIGGFVLKIDDKQLDASVVHQLEKIKREITR